MSIPEWEALPWHEQLVYMEGLKWELYRGDEEDEDEKTEDVTEDLDALSRYGIQVEHV